MQSIIYNILLLVAFVLGSLSFRAGLRHGLFLQKGCTPPAGDVKKEKDAAPNPEEDPKKDWTDQS